MTRIYEEAQIDVPLIGSGEEIYNFLIKKSSAGRFLLEAIKNKNYCEMCFFSARLGKIGYSDDELKKFFEFIFKELNIEDNVNS